MIISLTYVQKEKKNNQGRKLIAKKSLIFKKCVCKLEIYLD